MKRPTFRSVITGLRAQHGAPAAPPPQGPWQWVLWENVAYLAADEARAAAFELLRQRPGFDPAKILDADDDALLAATRHGIMAAQRAEKLRVCAQIALDQFDGNVDGVLKLPPKKAASALKKFPGIGAPGAEKILLLERVMPVLALDSNGLRVLLRLGFGAEQKNYAASYASAQKAVAGELPAGFDDLIEAHRLLRRHGQEICKHSGPHCADCRLRKTCPSAA